jgi:hypothetical protein
MVSHLHLTTIVLIAAGLWAALLILEGMKVTRTFFFPFEYVLSALVVVLAIFDRWAWRFRILRPWFVSLPDLNGVWKGQLQSDWTDPQTGKPSPPLDARVVVKQTFSSIHLRLATDESESELLSGGLVRKADGSYQIVAVYRNTPRLLVRDGSPIHHGGLVLNLEGHPPTGLRGEYWTDRRTRGELRFGERETRRRH